jgi:hypothetical protein
MPHHSRLAGLVIDCDTDGLDGLCGAAAFWGAALGDGRGRKPQGRYVGLDPRNGLHVAVQRVDHPSRVHLDIASDDVPAEVARLERLGARKVAEVRTWVVMEAPTGQRFCVTRARGADFAKGANAWDDAESGPGD